jgi:hypothetical protein
MSEDLADAVARAVAASPPLSEAQKDVLAAAFAGVELAPALQDVA